MNYKIVFIRSSFTCISNLPVFLLILLDLAAFKAALIVAFFHKRAMHVRTDRKRRLWKSPQVLVQEAINWSQHSTCTCVSAKKLNASVFFTFRSGNQFILGNNSLLQPNSASLDFGLQLVQRGRSRRKSFAEYRFACWRSTSNHLDLPLCKEQNEFEIVFRSTRIQQTNRAWRT